MLASNKWHKRQVIIISSVIEQLKSHEEDNSKLLRNCKDKSRDIICTLDADLANLELAFGNFKEKQLDPNAI